MEVFFHVPVNFFAQNDSFSQREKAQPEEKAQPIGQGIPQLQHQGAEQEKVNYAPQRHPQHQIDADLSIPGGHRIEEKGGGGRQPEQEIQNGSQPFPPKPHPQDPEQVV